MLLGEPRRTQFDINFRLFGFPIRIAPFFWLIAILIGQGIIQFGYGEFRIGGRAVLWWILAVFLSILIHELGHAFAFRYYRIPAHVVLYHFGGLAVPDSLTTAYMQTATARDPRSHVVISAAGPAAQLGAALLLMLVLRAGGFAIRFRIPFLSFLPGLSNGTLLPSPDVEFFSICFLIVSVFWALLNLLPVYPLDGGQIARDLFQLFGGANAVPQSLMLSIVTGGLVAFYAFSRQEPFMGIMFALLAFSSFQSYQMYTGGGGGFGRRPW